MISFTYTKKYNELNNKEKTKRDMQIAVKRPLNVQVELNLGFEGSDIHAYKEDM